MFIRKEMISANLICNIMALNSDMKCLRLCKSINLNQYLYWFKLKNKKKIFNKACKYGLIKIVKNLLSYADPSYLANSAIRWASDNGHTEIVKFLLQDKRVDPSVCDNDVILLASQKGHLEIVKLLLQDKRVDPSDCRNTAIQLASINGHLEIVKLLLQDKRVDSSADINYAIGIASKNGHLEIVKLLKEYLLKKK